MYLNVEEQAWNATT